MSLWHFLIAGLRHYWRIHLATAAGVATAGAVISGALIVGDSVRGSLRALAVDGLQRVEVLLQSELPFREALANDWPLDLPSQNLPASDAVDGPRYDKAKPLLVVRGAAVRQSNDSTALRAAGLQFWGIRDDFWDLAIRNTTSVPKNAPSLKLDEAALSASVAEELGVAVGDRILVTLPLRSQAPADSPLGEKDETSASRRFRVAAILSPERGDAMARLSLYPNQQAPRNVFLPLQAVQSMLDLPDQVNALALAREGDLGEAPLGDAELARIVAATRPKLADYGLRVHTVVPPNGTGNPLIQIDSEHLILPPHLVAVAEREFADVAIQPSIVALANRITHGDKTVPYSTVAGVDSLTPLGPLIDQDGKPLVLNDDETAINDWTARELGAQINDKISIAYYEPETTHGKLVEASPLTLTVRAILPLVDASEKPTRVVDPQLAPELPGVTDQKTINDWDLPFELVETIRDQDDVYWERYRTTPKAFVSLATAQRLWGTRWGTFTALRLPLGAPRTQTAEQVAQSLERAVNPALLGIRVMPIRSDALQAASGTTPFEGLFLGFSFFLLASALMLAALLFRLGVEQRASEIGLLLAIGFAPRRVLRTLLAEGLVASLFGATVGAVLGAAYARLMIHGLNTWWVDATAAPFLQLHVHWPSAGIGGAAALAASLVAIWATLRTLVRLPTPSLLAGDAQAQESAMGPKRPTLAWAGAAWIVMFVGASILGVAAWRWRGMAQAGGFLGSGALFLGAGLAGARSWLHASTTRPLRSLSLAGLAARSARRHPARSIMSLGLAASASFLIVGLGAFRLGPSEEGCGGFDFIATSDVPLQQDLNDGASRLDLGLSSADNEKLRDAHFVGFRVHDGGDASCLNLFQIGQPRVLGAPPKIRATSRFVWSDHRQVAERVSPWTLLDHDLGESVNGRQVVPMILDQNTAQYSLKLSGIGDRLTLRDGQDQPLTLEVVGLLAGSILQGDVIIGQRHFLERFPESSGERFFLVRVPGDEDQRNAAQSLLEQRLDDYGFDARDARQRLAELMAVQNTYLSTFQSLGGLGLLLGAVGLAVAQLRSVLERRGELALLRAVGFSKKRLGTLVLAENAALLLGGLGIGLLAAAGAVVPQAAANQTSAPWGTLTLLLATTAAAGLVTGSLAVRAATRAPLLPALRGE